MRRYLLLLLMMLSLAHGADARRVMWGVQAGWDTRKFKIDSDAFKVDKHSGWFIGPQASLQLPKVHMAIDASLLYNQRNMDLEQDETGQVYYRDLSYLVFPVNLRYTFRPVKLLGIYACTGPQWRRYLNRGNHISLVNGTVMRVDPSTLSWNAGFGVELLGHLSLGFTYNFGIDSEYWNDSTSLFAEGCKVKKNSCQVSVSCLF